MPLAEATITYNLAPLSGSAKGKYLVTATTNVPGDTVVDTLGDLIRIGQGKGVTDEMGVGSVKVWIPGEGSNPASWQTYIHVSYPNGRERGLRTFGPFTITASADLADLIAEQDIPPDYVAGVMGSIVAASESAAASATSAAASADIAEAITGADTADDLITILDADATSAFRVQQDARLTAKIATDVPTATTTTPGRVELATTAEVTTGTDAVRAITPASAAAVYVGKGDEVHNVKDFGATGDGTTDDTVAVQAAIDAGGTTLFPPGAYKCKGLVAPDFGMRLVGVATKGAGQSAIVGVTSDATDILTTAPGEIAYNWSIHNLHIEAAPSGGNCMSGAWALGVITGCVFVQPNAGKSAITVSVWIDCSVEQYTVFDHVTTATEPTFKALSAVGDVAQINFENLRFNNSGNYNIWLEATTSQMIHNVRITNVNFEVPSGGAINLLSCRNVLIENCGAWDFLAVGAQRNIINIGKSTGADNRAIVIRNYMRDASIAPIADRYDFAAVSTTELVIDSCQHPTGSLLANLTTTTGKVTNSPAVTLTNGAFLMETDVWQTRGVTLTGTGTAQGNGVLTFRQRRQGNTVEFQARFVLGTTSTIGTGGLSFSLSPAPVDDNKHTGLPVQFSDASPGVLLDGRALLAGATVKIYTSTYTTINATTPITWATGDVIEVRGAYEVAT